MLSYSCNPLQTTKGYIWCWSLFLLLFHKGEMWILPKCPIFFNIFLYYIIIFSVLVFRSMPRLYLHTNHLVYSNLNTFFLLYHLKWDWNNTIFLRLIANRFSCRCWYQYKTSFDSQHLETSHLLHILLYQMHTILR